MKALILAAAAAAIAAGASPAWAQTDPYASIAERQAAMAAGAVTVQQLVQQSLDRIGAMDRTGPRLNSVLALDPDALADARKLDAGRARGPLHGITLLLKDNIEAKGPLPTTAGSLALAGNVTGRDAPLVAKLRAGGAVILGKANLSEWANYRSTNSISGWSAVGGLVRNPYVLDRGACGSSSGSAVAVSAGLVVAAIGTETDGSLTCPASMNGVVAIKPTVGLVSRTHIVPISPQQDTAGPLARAVADVAAVLTVIAGSDPADPATKAADAHKSDYRKTLDAKALAGARIGVLRMTAGRSPQTDAVFDQALEVLRAQGAVLVEIPKPDAAVVTQLGQAETAALRSEFRASIEDYLASAAPQVKARSLGELIAFNAGEPRETALFGQEVFEQAAKAPALTDPAYVQARATARRLATQMLDGMLRDGGVQAIVAPTNGPASVVDPVNGSVWLGSSSTPPAVAGYPHLTVPMGQVSGLPVGLSFIGPAWSEARLLSLGYAYEQASHARRAPQFLPTVAALPRVGDAIDPR